MHNQVTDILEFLSGSFEENFTAYSPAVAEKIIQERSGQLGLNAPSSYLQLLCTDPGEASYFSRMLRVRYSAFFRDPLQFELLGTIILPAMLNACQGGTFRVWSAACAGGEETYSLAILLDELMQHHETGPHLQLFGTDVAEDALEEAAAGVYPASRVDSVSLNRLNTYFSVQNDRYRVKDNLRRMATFSRHDLLSQGAYAPPESIFGGFDVILCRNFLMYLDNAGYSRVFDNLLRALKPGGILMLGNAETLPEKYAAHFERVFAFGEMFRKRTVTRSHVC